MCEEIEKNTKYDSDGFLQVGQQNITSQHLSEPGFPVETAQKWLHEMGFEVLTARKGILLMAMNNQTLYHPAWSSSTRWQK